MNASIIGASGYSGAELLRILLHHQRVRIDKVFANSSAGKRVDEVYGIFRGRTDLVFEKYTLDQVSASDVVFVALPSGEAMHIAPELLKANKRVIDLGGDFRLKDVALYQKYYKHEHVSKDILPQAVYGLPEWNKEKIRRAQLVSNPGCYPTSAILPLLPLVKENLIEERGIAISSLSGVSGAGRSASVDLSFAEVNESVKAYKVGVHQHTPEIESAISESSGRTVTVTFVPHLIPITRGINSTIYARLTRPSTQDEVAAMYRKYYWAAPFVSH